MLALSVHWPCNCIVTTAPILLDFPFPVYWWRHSIMQGVSYGDIYIYMKNSDGMGPGNWVDRGGITPSSPRALRDRSMETVQLLRQEDTVEGKRREWHSRLKDILKSGTSNIRSAVIPDLLSVDLSLFLQGCLFVHFWSGFIWFSVYFLT